MATQEQKLKRLVEKLDADTETYQQTVEKFKGQLEVNPVYAFEWADGVMEYAAKYKVAVLLKQTIAGLSPDSAENVLAAVRSEVLKETIRGARWPSQSTSACSNSMARCMTAAWAELADKLS